MDRLVHDLESISPLFAASPHLVAIRRAALESRLGQVWVDALEAPTVARIELGCYAIFGGDAHAAEARELIRGVRAPIELVYPDSRWRRAILAVHGKGLQDRPMEGFSGDSLEPAELGRMGEGLPEGYVLRRLDTGSAEQLDGELEPHGLQTYGSPEHLVSEGLAWGAFLDGPERRLVSVASSYARSSRLVEVAISTRPEHRGRGLAAATAARFCLGALDLGLEPRWNAANPISRRLAHRLGFRSLGWCEVLFWET
ncbi:MAG: GNAT family N-acetyltransferase [Holophagales bacterium]|nr:GNAT family N-acetyltransferase [Holophagales bacterium]